MTDTILLKKEGSLRWLIFNQPKKKNAISLDMSMRALDVIGKVAQDDDARVLIVAGAGDTFVAGADISEFEKMRNDAASTARYRETAHRLYHALQHLEKPTVAMIHGYCFGGGVGLAASCDLRLCADNAVFSIPAARLGVAYPIEFTRLLTGLVGPSVMKEILYTARRYTATEAQALGLVNRVVPRADLEPYARTYAEGIAANAPLSVRASKIIIDESMKDTPSQDLERCNRAAAACADSEDFRIGRTAFMQKSKPHFTGR